MLMAEYSQEEIHHFIVNEFIVRYEISKSIGFKDHGWAVSTESYYYMRGLLTICLKLC